MGEIVEAGQDEESDVVKHLKSKLPQVYSTHVALFQDEDSASVMDQHIHSVSTRKVVLQLWNNPFAKMSLEMRTSARIGDLTRELSHKLGVSEDNIKILFQNGKYFKQAYETHEIRSKLLVKGINSFGQVSIPLVERNKWMPGFDMLPQSKKNKLGGRAPPKTPKTRAFAFYGPSDGFGKGWADYIILSPEWVEFIVYEWPGHGTREDEDLPADMDSMVADALEGMGSTFEEHGKGGMAEIADFVLIGHGLGALVMMLVAKAIEEKYQVKPAVVFVVDRVAPQHEMFSEHGAKLLKDDPEAFMAEWMPEQDGTKNDVSAGFITEQTRFLTDTIKESSIKLDCDIVVFRPLGHYMTAEGEEREALLVPPREAWDDWSTWTTKAAPVTDIASDYISSRMNGQFIEDLFGRLQKLLQKNF